MTEIRLTYHDDLQAQVALRMQELALRDGADFLMAVIAHGSLGSDELIPYSDFDGLLILKNGAENHPGYAAFMRKSLAEMYRFDPLQHHGWFIIREADLDCWPQHYFPLELFDHARLLYPKHVVTFPITVQPETDYHRPFEQLCMGLRSKIDRQFAPKNAYQLKSLLSEIMLLPALYYQAKDQRGLFKKTSFERLYQDFTADDLALITRVSDIRMQWNHQANKLTLNLLHIPNRLVRKVLTSYILRDRTTQKLIPSLPGFYADLKRFIDLLNEHLKAHE